MAGLPLAGPEKDRFHSIKGLPAPCQITACGKRPSIGDGKEAGIPGCQPLFCAILVSMEAVRLPADCGRLVCRNILGGRAQSINPSLPARQHALL